MWLRLWMLVREAGDSIRHGGESVAFVGIGAAIAMHGGGEVRGVVQVEPLNFGDVPGDRE